MSLGNRAPPRGPPQRSLSATGFADAKLILAQSFRGSVQLLQREDGSYGSFEGWTWYIPAKPEDAQKTWRRLIMGPKPSKKVVMHSELAEKHFDKSLGVLRPDQSLGVVIMLLAPTAVQTGPAKIGRYIQRVHTN